MKTKISFFSTLCFLFAFTFSTTAIAQQITFMVDETWEPAKDHFTSIQVILPNDTPRDGEVRFTLRTSSWPGYCMNGYFGATPNEACNHEYDLFFIKNNQANITGITWLVSGSPTAKVLSITAKWTNGAPASIPLRVDCDDYGPVGKLHAYIHNAYDSSTNPDDTADAANSANTLLIPFENDPLMNKNHISDYYERNTWDWTGNAMDDTEDGPRGNMVFGDGLCAFEEWRGFLIGGSHQRTNPKKKDLFIFSDLIQGYGWASKLPSVFAPHLINENEMEGKSKDGSRVINYLACMPYHVLNQKAIWVAEDATGGDGILGQAIGIGAPNISLKEAKRTGTQGPARASKVIIYTARIQNLGVNVSMVIGHEIAHCLDLPHVTNFIPDGNDWIVLFEWETKLPFVFAYGRTNITKKVLSIMAPSDGMFVGNKFPEYHNPQYYMVPENVQPEEKAPSYSSTLPADFNGPFIITNFIAGTPSDTDTTPSAPTDLSASFGDGQVTLSWTASSGTVTGYQYRYHENGGSWGSWIPTGSLGTTVDVFGLTNGTTYEVQVSAVNGLFASAASNTVEGAPVTVPNAPTSLSGYGYNGWISLSWTAPSDDGGATISDYEYRYSRTSQSFGSSWISAGGINTLKSVFGLTNGTQYKFQVRAKNSAGVSTESRTAYATPVTVPGIPQNVTSTAGDGEVSLYWDAPNSNGGSTITDYEYSYREGSSGNFGSWTSAGTDQWERVTGLTNDTSYEFRVRARNRIGPGTSAGPIEATPEVPIVPPGPPRNLRGTDGDGQVTLRWDAPLSNGGAAITDYEYRLDTNNDGTWTAWDSTGEANTYETFTGLTNGTTYAFQVRAINSVGTSLASNEVTVTPQTSATVPGTIETVGAVGGNGYIAMLWSVPSDGGSTITHYEYRYRQSSGTWSSWTSTGNINGVRINGLTNGTEYELEVRAVNSVGAGPSSSTTATPTNETSPGPPQYLDADADNGSVTLWWDAPDSDGNTPITDYEYQYRESGGSWSSWTSTGTIDWSYTVSGLTNGTTYEFQVQARNVIGTGASSGTVSATPNTTEPDSPTGLSTWVCKVFGMNITQLQRLL